MDKGFFWSISATFYMAEQSIKRDIEGFSKTKHHWFSPFSHFIWLLRNYSASWCRAFQEPVKNCTG